MDPPAGPPQPPLDQVVHGVLDPRGPVQLGYGQLAGGSRWHTATLPQPPDPDHARQAGPGAEPVRRPGHV
ncbi:hypothetical protein Sar04_44240 [Salinispora arenicola]|uniref:Uncharacterized protein n=1 Tax=Salinispora arenicola TaxID=168697 RepID=A0ABQ4JZT2_SALAC|nr:hypothetical protein Sar04_44240 [Salinispora arenicola]